MLITRRWLIERLIALSAMPVAFRFGTSKAQAALAPDGVTRYISIEEQFDGTMRRLFENRVVDYGSAVSLTTPQMAENGRVVPVEVKFDYPMDAAATSFPERLYLIVDNNRRPLSVVFAFTPATNGGFAACNLRMGGTSPVRAIIEMSDGKLAGAVKNVNVVVGGCGG
jgi:sulfur-oxidizing protein SoxY